MGMGMDYRIACFFAYVYIHMYIQVPDCNCCIITSSSLYPSVSSNITYAAG